MEIVKQVKVKEVEWKDNVVEGLVTIWLEYDPTQPTFAGQVEITVDAGAQDLDWVWRLLQLDRKAAKWRSEIKVFSIKLEIVRSDDFRDLFSQLVGTATTQLAPLEEHIAQRKKVGLVFDQCWKDIIEPFTA